MHSASTTIQTPARIVRGSLSCESPHETWNSPENLADFLYELRHRLRTQKKLPRQPTDDYQSLYQYLGLQDVLPFEQFDAIAQTDAEPERPLLEHLYRFLQERYQQSAVEVYLYAVQPHLKNGEVLSLHPYVLTAVLQSRLGDDRGALYRMAQDLNIYPSMLQALREGDLVAPPALRDKICRYLKCSDEEKVRIQQSGIEYLRVIEANDPRRTFLMQKLAETDRDTPMVQFMQGLLYDGSPVTREHFAQAAESGMAPLDTVMADAREKSKTLRNRRFYETAIVQQIADEMGVSDAQKSIVLDMGARRSLGALIEDYTFAGGKSWAGFWTFVEKEWHTGSQTIAKMVDVSRAQLYQWMNRSAENSAGIEARTIDKIASATRLDLVQKDLLQALGSGDLTIGADYKQVLQSLQDEMQQKETLKEREAFARKCFQTLLLRSGKSVHSIVAAVGGYEETLRNHGKGEGVYDYHWIEIADQVAAVLCPYSSKALRQQTALLLLGVPYKRSPADLLEAVLEGDMRMGEMVREYRLSHLQTTAEFARSIPPGFTADQLNLAENASDVPPCKALVEALADHMQFQGVQRQQCIAALNGIKMDYPRPSEVLDMAVDRKATFGDVVQAIIQMRHGHVVRRADHMGYVHIAKELEVKPRTVMTWQKNISCPAGDMILRLAQLGDIPEEKISQLQDIARRDTRRPPVAEQGHVALLQRNTEAAGMTIPR